MTAPQDLTEERAAFEAWADSRRGTSLRSSTSGDFDYPLGHLLWEAWSARAALAGAAAAIPEGWISAEERMPEPGTECFVWHREVVLGFGPYATVDRWDEQREAPVSFSSATIPIGPGWDNAEFDDVLFWKPVIAPGAAAPLAATPAQAVEEAAATNLKTVQALVDALMHADAGLKWYRDTHPEDTDGSDDEAAEMIDAAIASGRALIEQMKLEQEAQPTKPFARGSWQHAVDDELVNFGKTSQEFSTPHEAVAWLLGVQAEYAVSCSQPTSAECGNTPYDEGPFTIAQPTSEARCPNVRGNARDGYYCNQCGSGPCASEAPAAKAVRTLIAPHAVWLIFFDDYDRRPEIIIGEAAARHRFARISDNWNAHLFVKVESNTRDDPYAKANAALSGAAGVPQGWKLLKDTTHEERSWPEDYAHENGSYFCLCSHCLRQFQGHKRRVVCKVCASAAPGVPQEPSADAIRAGVDGVGAPSAEAQQQGNGGAG